MSGRINFGQQLFDSCTRLKELHEEGLEIYKSLIDHIADKSCLKILKLSNVNNDDIDDIESLCSAASDTFFHLSLGSLMSRYEFEEVMQYIDYSNVFFHPSKGLRKKSCCSKDWNDGASYYVERYYG